MMRGRTERLHGDASEYIYSERRAVKRTDYYWLRLLGTGLWFVVFGLVTFVLGFLVLPVIRLVTPDRRRRSAQDGLCGDARPEFAERQAHRRDALRVHGAAGPGVQRGAGGAAPARGHSGRHQEIRRQRGRPE